MRAEHLRDGSRSRALLCLKLFKEAHCGAWIIAGLVKVLQPEVIGFGFVLTRELQELHRNQEPRCLPKSEAADAAHEDQRDRSEIDQLGLRRLLRRVARRDVRDLMRHNTGQFRFIVRSQNQTGVDVEEPAGESECIDLLGFNDLDRERKDSAEIQQTQIPSGDKMSVRRCRSTSSWYRYLSWPTYRQASSMPIPLRHGSPLSERPLRS